MDTGRFTLPQTCRCGARGTVTFQPVASQVPGAHPELRVAGVDGPFRVEGRGEIVCLNCEDLAGAARFG